MALAGASGTSVCMMAIVLSLDAAEMQRRAAERDAVVKNHMNHVATEVTKDLDVAIGELRSLTFWIATEPQLASRRFDDYSRNLLSSYPTLRSTTILEDDVITQTYPANPDLLGFDVGNHPVQGKVVQRLRHSREVLVTGPVDLAQGGQGLILRAPVYRYSGVRRARYWGHVSLVFDTARVNQVLSSSVGTPLAKLRLSDADGQGATATLDLGDRDAGQFADQTVDFQVPGETWRLTAGVNPMVVGLHTHSWLLGAGALLALLCGVGVGLLLITSRRLNERNLELQVLATTDPLTGAYNRRFIVDQCDTELARSRRSGEPFSVVMLDLDHFKAINDQYGHAAGDNALKAAVAVVKDHLRTTDTVGRWGGEELLVVAVHTDQKGALELAERLRQRIEKTEVRAGLARFSVSASFGVAEALLSDTSESLIDRADGGLYQAKANGRNRCESVPAPSSSRVQVVSQVARSERKLN